MEEVNNISSKPNKKKITIVIIATVLFLLIIGIYFYLSHNPKSKSMDEQEKFLYLESLRNQLNSNQTTPEQKQAILFFLEKQQEAIDANNASDDQLQTNKDKSNFLKSIK